MRRLNRNLHRLRSATPTYYSRQRRWVHDEPLLDVEALRKLPHPPIDAELGCYPEIERLGGMQARIATWTKLRKEYGDVVYVPLPGRHDVFVFDPDGIQTVFRNDKPTPIGSAVQLGPFLGPIGTQSHTVSMSLGEQWQRLRHALQRNFFRPNEARRYVDAMAPTIAEAVPSIGSQGMTMPQFTSLLSMELMGRVLFNKRLGALGEGDGEHSTFVRTALDAFSAIGHFLYAHEITQDEIDAHEAKLQYILDHGAQLVDETLQRIKDGDETASTSYIAHLLQSGDLTRNEITQNAAAFLFAAVDTTSNAMQWLTYNLARNQEAQAVLREEVLSVMGSDGPLHQDHLGSLPYARQCIKESFRVTPTTLGTSRRLENDVCVQGHVIPKGTLITVVPVLEALDASVFHDADQFVPERWDPTQRKARKELHPSVSHPMTVMPFSKGPRMCLGARVAENELMAFVCGMVQKWSWTRLNDAQPQVLTALLNVPSVPLAYNFEQVSE